MTDDVKNDSSCLWTDICECVYYPYFVTLLCVILRNCTLITSVYLRRAQ